MNITQCCRDSFWKFVLIVAVNFLMVNSLISNVGSNENVLMTDEFTDTAISTDWFKTDGRIDLSAVGRFSITPQFEKSKTYEFRAVVEHPLIKIYGDIERFTAK